MANTSLCDECHEAGREWLDYRPPRTVKIMQHGAPEWNVPAGDRIRETIKNQIDLIHRICARKHQLRAVRGTPKTNRPVIAADELTLFDVEEATA